MQKIDIRQLPPTSSLNNLTGQLHQYQRALGRHPSQYIVSQSQMAHINSSIRRKQRADKKAGIEDEINYIPEFSGVTIKTERG